MNLSRNSLRILAEKPIFFAVNLMWLENSRRDLPKVRKRKQSNMEILLDKAISSNLEECPLWSKRAVLTSKGGRRLKKSMRRCNSLTRFKWELMGLSSIKGRGPSWITTIHSPCLATDMFRICALERLEVTLPIQIGLLTLGQGGVKLIE